MRQVQPIAISPFTMAMALAAADRAFRRTVPWAGDARVVGQQAWLARFRPRAGQAAKIPEIENNATRDFSQHEAWLKARGWDSQITPAPDMLFLAAVLDVLCTWQHPGGSYQETCQPPGELISRALHRVMLTDGVMLKRRPNSSEAPIVSIVTTTGDRVWVQEVETDFGGDQAQLLEYVQRFITEPDQGEWPAVLDFPTVDLDLKVSADHMIGITIADGKDAATVGQAFEQYRFEMTRRGARARAVAEIGLDECCTAEPPPLVKISGPFVAAILRPDVEEPIFGAYCPPSVWKTPKNEADR